MNEQEQKEFDNKIGNKLCYIGDRGQEHLKNIQDFINQLLKTRSKENERTNKNGNVCTKCQELKNSLRSKTWYYQKKGWTELVKKMNRQYNSLFGSVNS